MNRRLCVTVPPYGLPHDDTLFIVLSLIHTIVSYERRPGRALLLDLLTAMSALDGWMNERTEAKEDLMLQILPPLARRHPQSEERKTRFMVMQLNCVHYLSPTSPY
jgi:hypothetical protein